MDKTKILSGHEIVAKGITKYDAALPETGLKDAVPNGSWLEQKQIQAALEARKHLIEVERIQKRGSLSYAEWRDDLKLAEVTHKVGGHWQYVGHYLDKKLYLRPEEALFLMEVNCLLLKHNEITVSLQKAYSLLLHDTQSIIQYRVYASLSRLGYKVFRHRTPDQKEVAIITTICEATEGSESTVQNIDPMEIEIDVEKQDENVLHTEINDNLVNEPAGCMKNEETVNNCTEKQYSKSKTCENSKNTENNSVVTENLENTNNLSKSTETDENENTKSVTSPKKDENDCEKSQSKIIISTDCNTQKASENLLQNEDNENMESQNNKGTENIDNSDKNPIVEEASNTDQNMELEDSAISLEDSLSCAGQQVFKETEKINGNSDIGTINTANNNRDDAQPKFIQKLNKLCNRRFKPTDTELLHKHFENVPELYKNLLVTIDVPKSDLIPKNIFVNKTTYVVNLQNVTTKSIRPLSRESSYSSSIDEVNESHVRRIRSTSGAETPPNPFPNNRFVRQNFNYQPYNFWRPQNHPNFYQFRMFFQRPFISNTYFLPRFQYRHRVTQFMGSIPNLNNANFGMNHVETHPNLPNVNFASNQRKRKRTDVKASQLQGIKGLAARLKTLIMSGNTQSHNIQALQRLLHTYNTKYKTRLRLTENFDLINDETIVDTIDLEDEEECSEIQGKKSRLDKKGETKHTENLNTLKQLALKLKDLETKNKVISRHRRVFSNAIKTFNKCYNADVYLNSSYEVIDRNHVIVSSSSESDCVVEDTNDKFSKKKKLRNPFNILKRLSEKLDTTNIPTTSKDERQNQSVQNIVYSNRLKNTFDKNWMPNENDFGRAEVVRKSVHTNYADSYKEEHVLEFMKDQPNLYENWLDAKISFLKYVKEASLAFKKHLLQNEVLEVSSSSLKPLISIDDCVNMSSVLEKLRIIQNNKDCNSEANLGIDFDVYNRDVPNFKKTNPPKPHFRLICIHESTTVPTAADVSALYATYDQKIPIVFGIVGLSSISYLQINPTDLPVYIQSKELL